jgi:hypothetical protein
MIQNQKQIPIAIGTISHLSTETVPKNQYEKCVN